MLGTATANRFVGQLSQDDVIVIEVTDRDVHRIKKAPGSRYHAHPDDHLDRPHWALSLSWGSCVTLRGIFGADLIVGPELAEWARIERADRIDPAMKLRDRLELDGWDSTLPEKLFDYQKVGATFAMVAERAIIADPMGAGKSAETIAALRALEAYPILVVAPNSMLHTWQDEFAMWWPGARVELITGPAGRRRKAIDRVRIGEATVAVINWEGLRGHTKLSGYGSAVALTDREKEPKELNEIDWAAVVADEAHRAKDPRSKQTRALWAVSADATYRFALTGHPVPNTPEDLWTLGRFVSPEEFPSKTAWIDRYCDAGFNIWGGLSVLGLKDETKTELFAYLDPRFLRRPKELILPQLPPKTYSRRTVELGTKQRAAYNEMRKEMLADLDTGTTYVTNALSKLIRLRQFAAAYAEIDGETIRLTEPSCKIDALVDIFDEMGGRPVVVFAESRQLIELAGARLEKIYPEQIGYITGTVDRDKRARTIDQFQAGKLLAVLCTLGAGGEGITLTAADTVVFLQRSFSRAKSEQAEDRIHRIGQEASAVEVIDIVAADTVEARIEEVLRDKSVLSEEIVRDRETFLRMLDSKKAGE